MARTNAVNEQLGTMEGVYLATLYVMQSKTTNGVAADLLPYTANLKWIVAEMTAKFPHKNWTEKLCFRSLLRMRKAGALGKTEKAGGKVEIPEFPADNDLEEGVFVFEAKNTTDPPEEAESDQ